MIGENGPLSDLNNLPRFQECDLKYVFAFESIIPDFDKNKEVLYLFLFCSINTC